MFTIVNFFWCCIFLNMTVWTNLRVQPLQTASTQLSSSLLLPPLVARSGCEHGRWNCSLEHCPVDGGLSPWSSWSACSLSCGGLGLKTRTRGCTQPAPAHGGRDCQGPRQETTYCQAPDCPGMVTSCNCWCAYVKLNQKSL